MEKWPTSFHWLRRELGLICRHACLVWRLVPVKHKLAFGGALVLIFITSTLNTAIPLLLGRLVDELQAIKQSSGITGGSDKFFNTALFYLFVISCTYLIRETIHIIRRYFVENSCTHIDQDMSIRVVGHLLQMDLFHFTHQKVGALHGRISRGVEGFVRFLRLFFLDFFPAILTGILALVATLSKEPRLGLVMVAVIPVSIFLTVWQLITQQDVRLKLLRTREEMDGTVVEQLSGIDYIRAANTVPQEVKRVTLSAEKRRSREIRHHFQMSLFGSGKALNEGLFHVLVLGVAIYRAAHGSIGFYDILVFSMLFLNVMTPLSEIHRIIDEGHEASIHVGDLLEILTSPTDRSFKPIPEPRLKLDMAGALITVDNLQVEYITALGQKRQALRGLNLTIRRGERIGIAGRSGSGKSTWLKVLLRLVHADGGQIRFGGLPLEAISRETIGELIGYVGQVPFVFGGTIAENIAYGREGASLEEIQQAAKQACIHEEILAMPGGYQAQVAEKGQNLSGGQRQRLALARLFLKNPPVLILDEATAALDNISERCVQRAIDAMRRDRTVILVAHRLSTLLDTDRILVFDSGRIVESGTYSELMEAGGVFTELLMCAETVASPSPYFEEVGEATEQPVPAIPGGV